MVKSKHYHRRPGHALLCHIHHLAHSLPRLRHIMQAFFPVCEGGER